MRTNVTRRHFLKRTGQVAAVAAVAPEIILDVATTRGHTTIQPFRVEVAPQRRWLVGKIEILKRYDLWCCQVYYSITHLPSGNEYEWAMLWDITDTKEEILKRCYPLIKQATKRVMQKYGGMESVCVH